MTGPPHRTQLFSRRPARAIAGVGLALAAGATMIRARAERDHALRELEAARETTRWNARFGFEVREVAIAAASGEMSEQELAALAASRLRDLFDATTAAVIRADPEGLAIVGYAGPTPYPSLLRWDERSSSAQAVQTGRLARVEDYGPPSESVSAFIAAQHVTCGISVPVPIHGHTWGCLTVTTGRPGGFSPEREEQLERFAKFVAAPLASTHGQEQLAFRARVEEALREVAWASTSSETDEQALGTLAAERVADLLGSPAVALISVEHARLTILGSAGCGALPSDTPIDEHSAAARAIRAGAPVIIDDYAEVDSPFADIAHDVGGEQAVAVPVFLGGQVWGAFSALLTPDIVPSHAVASMERFAAIISAALANAQAQARLQFRARLEETLREVAVASSSGETDERALASLVAARIAELLDAPSSSVVRFSPDGLTLLGSGGPGALPVDHRVDERSVAGQVAAQGTTVVIDDYLGFAAGRYEATARRWGACSAIGVPVFVGGQLWGSLGVMTRATDHMPLAVELMERLAQLISAALANTHAQTRLRDEARLERMLGRITAASATGRLDDRGLGELVADAVSELLEASVSAVVRHDGDWLTTLGSRGQGVPERSPIGSPSVSATVIKTGRIVRTDDVASFGGEVVDQILANQSVGTVIGVPVESQGRVWGALVAATAPSTQFDAHSVHSLARFAQLISATVANTEAQALLRQRAAVMASLHDGLVVLDDAGEITAVNEPLCALTGFSTAELVGRRAPYPFSVADGEDALADTSGANAVERVLRRRDGSLVRVVASVSTFDHGDGTSAGRAAILRDVSESVAQARLERAMRTVASASADRHLDEPGLADLVATVTADLLDAPLAAVVRFEPGDRMTVLGHTGEFAFPAALDPDDPETVSAIVAQTGRPARVDDYSAVAGSFAARATEAGVAGAVGVPVRLDGRLWGCIGSLTTRGGGFPLGTERQLERFADVLSVALANARSLRRLQQEARIEHALREVASASASGHHGADALFTLVAARVAAILDAPLGVVVRVDGATGTVLGRHGAEALADTLEVDDSFAAPRALASGSPVRIEDIAAEGSTGGVPEQVKASGCRTAIIVPVTLHERPWGYIAVARQAPHSFPSNAESLIERFAALVSLALAQADTLAELQRQATTDDLTGLLNHRAFQQRLHVEFARATRHGRPLALVMFDLDGFKLVNDLHGHKVGNRVLQVVGQCLQQHGRLGDIPARVGGDEFAVIAPETDATQALAIASRLRTVVTEMLRGQKLPITLSAGVTDISDAVTMHDLFHLADSALYYAKHHGRDQVARGTGDERHHEMSERRSGR